MIVRESDFNNGIETLKLAEHLFINLKIEAVDKYNYVDVSVTMIGTSMFLKKFAQIEPRVGPNNKLGNGLYLHYVRQDKTATSVTIIGMYSAVSVVGREATVNSVAEFNRSADDDQGFYHMKFLEVDGGFIIVYEGGAIRLTFDGKLEWQVKLCWDDNYHDCDSDLLYYSSEYGEFASKRWGISVRDGTKSILDR